MTLYMQDFLMDLDYLEREIDTIPLRGLKGTTGTQVGGVGGRVGFIGIDRPLSRKIRARTHRRRSWSCLRATTPR